MKKAVQICGVLAVMLCFGMTAMFYFFLDAAQLECRMEAKSSMRTGGGMETIKLPLEEFKANREDDEIWIGGRLYDISKYSVQRDSVLVTVFHDREEEGVVKNIVAGFGENGNHNMARYSNHHLPLPDEGKILVAPFQLKAGISSVDCGHFPLWRIGYIPLFSCSVIKPPPRKAIA